MVRESRAGRGREGFDELQVVRGRDDRDVPHVGGQEGQLRLHVQSGAVPPEECVDGESVTEIMRAWEMPRRGPDAGPPEECPHGAAEAPAAVAASARMAMPEQRAVRPGWKSPPVANRDQVLDLEGGIRRYRDEAGLVELGLADRQRALRRVVVSHGQPRQLTASQSGGGQQHDREAHVLGTEWRIGGAGQRARDGQQLDYLCLHTAPGNRECALGDLRRYESKAQLKKQGHGMHDALAYWEFCREMKPGDTIFVKKGARLVLGHGVVRSDYRFDEARPEYKHVRDVEWLSRTDGVRIREKELVRKTLTDITKFPDQVAGAKRALNIEDSPSEAWSELLCRIERCRAAPNFEADEVTYKLELAAKVNAARKRLESGATGWEDLLNHAFTDSHNTPALSSYFELMDRLLPSFLGALADQSISGTRIMLK